jgi:hypothetical protein
MNRRDTNAPRSKPAVRTCHMRDLEAALGSSIGRSFDVLSSQFRDAHSKKRSCQ